MSTQAEGTLSHPTSGFQFTLHTEPNEQGYNFVPEGEVGFTEIAGLEDSTEVQDYKEGNDLYGKKYPGRSTPGELTLRRGLDRNNRLLTWRNAVKERTQLPQQGFRNNLYVSVFERTGVPDHAEAGVFKVTVWKYQDAWCSALSLSDLSASSSDITTQSVTIQYNGVPEQVFPALG